MIKIFGIESDPTRPESKSKMIQIDSNPKILTRAHPYKLVFRQVTLLTPTRVLPLSGEDCRSSQGRPSSPLPPVAPPIEQHKVLLVFLSCCWGSGGRGPSRLSCPFSCLFCPTQIPQRREEGVVSSSGCIAWYEALARREGERFVLRSRTIKMSRHDKKGGRRSMPR